MSEYAALQQSLARGWNTWNTRSVLSHVLLPEGLALNLGLKDYAGPNELREALIGRQGAEDERIHPGPRTYDGGYTELTLRWRKVEMVVQSGTDGDDLVLLVTPKSTQRKPPLLVVEAGLLWNRSGYVQRQGDQLVGKMPSREVTAWVTGTIVEEPYVSTQGPYLAMELTEPIGISTGRPRSVEEITTILAAKKAKQEAYCTRFGDLAESYAAMQTCLAWDTIYDPLKDRVVSPVSRIWNVNWGGYVLFEWDNYFAALIAALDNKALAYANAVEMTREITPQGLVPNFASGNGCKSFDRSEPPVGCMAIRELYRRFGDTWLLEEVFDDLLTWNRWWAANRDNGGLLSWGSTPFEPLMDQHWEHTGVNERFGASLESGLDNSPMYDDIPFDTQTHLLQMADVGLTGLYVRECTALAEIAEIIGREETAEVRERAERYAASLQSLWSETDGIFLNRRTDTGEFSHRLSPTNFYPLLGHVATLEQAERMITEHFYNPEEFWGEWILPSIARNDPAYPDQDYWRGRIWAPMNFLVYLGLREYDLPGATADLVQKSQALLLKEWREHGHVHENYNGDTGEGCDIGNSDRFYHWGGLLGLIPFMDAGYFDQPAVGNS
ncbi:MAG: MGH1-like glycoside hydrolase domain-containing protein [Armatimonadota bacterium]